MDKYIEINSILLKQENADIEQKIISEYIIASQNYIKASETLLKTIKTINDYRPVYSINVVETKQSFTEFTGYNPKPYGLGGQNSPLDYFPSFLRYQPPPMF